MFKLGIVILLSSCSDLNDINKVNEGQLLPESLEKYLNGIFPAFRFPSDDQIKVSSVYSEIESKFSYHPNWKEYIVGADFTGNGFNDYALILTKASFNESFGDSVWLYTTVIVNTIKKDEYEHYPKDLFLRSSVDSKDIMERFGILEKGIYKRGSPHFDSLYIDKISIGRVIESCCVSALTWNVKEYQERYFFNE